MEQVPDMRWLRLPQVLARINVSKTYFYTGMKLGIFPAPLKLGRASVWTEESIRLAMNKIAATNEAA